MCFHVDHQFLCNRIHSQLPHSLLHPDLIRGVLEISYISNYMLKTKLELLIPHHNNSTSKFIFLTNPTRQHATSLIRIIFITFVLIVQICLRIEGAYLGCLLSASWNKHVAHNIQRIESARFYCKQIISSYKLIPPPTQKKSFPFQHIHFRVPPHPVSSINAISNQWKLGSLLRMQHPLYFNFHPLISIVLNTFTGIF